jgi:hypothetical protein
MKKKKKVVLLPLSLALLTFFLVRPGDETPVKITQTEKGAQKINRAIASIPATNLASKSKSSSTHPREIVGEKHAGQLKIINQVNQSWQQLYQKRLNQQGELSELSIELKKSLLKVKKGIGRNLEHVKVSFKRADGSPFSFEALVDSQTGSPIQTWNKTHYEFNQDLKLDPSGKIYRE